MSVVLGVPFGVPYPTPGPAAGCAEAPAAIRARSQRLARFADHHDFDLDGPMLPLGSATASPTPATSPARPRTARATPRRTEAVVRQLLGVGAVPILLGGDDSVPIPFLRAYADRGPITVLQVDAHLDFRDEVAGVRDGYSSPCAARPRWGTSSASCRSACAASAAPAPSDVADARAAGNLLVTARELASAAWRGCSGQLPADASVLVCLRPGRARPVGGARGERHRARRADLRPGGATCCWG